jgi:hypothetical protein
MTKVTEEQARDIAAFIRAICHTLGSPMPKEMQDLDVLRFMKHLIDERNRLH